MDGNGGRNFQGEQHTRLGRGGQVGHIGVPDCLAMAQAADRHAVFDDVGNDINLRHPVCDPSAVLLVRRMIQLAEQERLHHFLHGWLMLHVPLSLALLLLGCIHAFMALRY